METTVITLENGIVTETTTNTRQATYTVEQYTKIVQEQLTQMQAGLSTYTAEVTNNLNKLQDKLDTINNLNQ